MLAHFYKYIIFTIHWFIANINNAASSMLLMLSVMQYNFSNTYYFFVIFYNSSVDVIDKSVLLFTFCLFVKAKS